MKIDDKPQGWIDSIDEGFRKFLNDRTKQQIEFRDGMRQAEETERKIKKANEHISGATTPKNL